MMTKGESDNLLETALRILNIDMSTLGTENIKAEDVASMTEESKWGLIYQYRYPGASLLDFSRSYQVDYAARAELTQAEIEKTQRHDWSLNITEYRNSELLKDRVFVTYLLDNHCFKSALCGGYDGFAWDVLRCASEGLKNDFEFVLKVVQLDGNALVAASEALQKDEVIARAAITNYGPVIRQLPSEIREKHDLALIAFNQRVTFKMIMKILNRLPENLRNNPEIVWAASKRHRQTIAIQGILLLTAWTSIAINYKSDSFYFWLVLSVLFVPGMVFDGLEVKEILGKEPLAKAYASAPNISGCMSQFLGRAQGFFNEPSNLDVLQEAGAGYGTSLSP